MSRWGYGGWKPYVPVAKKREQANRALQKAKKAGQEMSPILLASRGAIAKTFWGKAWCDNLEAYSDFESRLPRGRTYVRNGAVIDLRIEPGKVSAQVMGSSLYRVEIGIATVAPKKWQGLIRECTGSIASLVDLLQGELSTAVMERVCAPTTGLFPSPKEIQLDCSCPDWATMCKHVAAVLYGVGARLDEQPELLFTLRQVSASDLVTRAAAQPVKAKKVSNRSTVLDAAALEEVFGIEMAPATVPTKGTKTPAKRTPAKKATAPAPARKSRASAPSTAKSKEPKARRSSGSQT